ncbi:alpha/beta fold hydrolase [Ensifer canadensis]
MTLAVTLYAMSAIPGLTQSNKPTIVLVHGAFADSSSWNQVISRLEMHGYSIVAVANPLRGVKRDGDYVRQAIKRIKTPIVLVGHSYGGSVISNAAAGLENVKALVFVAAFAPEVGESAVDLSGKFPGSTLAPALGEPVTLANGEGKDLYIDQRKFPEQFAADVPLAEAKLMAATQRPITDAALAEPAAKTAWKEKPSWFIHGDADRNIPPHALRWMAERANSRKTVVVRGGSHVVMVSHPGQVAKLIEEAASAK